MASDDRAERIRRELFLRALTPAKPPTAFARAMASVMKEVRFAAGDTIYRRGDPSTTVYFVAEGVIACVAEGEPPWVFDAGSVVGVLDINLLRPRARTAFAKTDLVVLALAADDWLDILEDNLSFVADSRRIVSGMLHDMILELAPDGAFPRVESSDREVARPVLEGTVVERLVVLRESHHFEHASVQALVELARRGEVVRLARGETLWNPGGAGRRVALTLSGIVDAERRLAPMVRASFGRADLVLGSASFAGSLNEYVVTARSDALVLVLSWTDIDDVVEDHFDLVRAMFFGSSVERERCMAAREARRPRRETG